MFCFSFNSKFSIFQILAVKNKIFIAITIVVITDNVNNAEKVEDTIFPIPIPIKVPVTPSIPNLLTITKVTPDNKSKVELFLDILIKKPTIKPSKTRTI